MTSRKARPEPQGTPKRASRKAQAGAVLSFADNARLRNLVGEHDRHLARIEQKLSVHIARRGNELSVTGDADGVGQARLVLETLYARADGDLTQADVDSEIRFGEDGGGKMQPGTVRTPRRIVRARTRAQAAYLAALEKHELTLGLGPAGTGKTYLAVAMAASFFSRGIVERIVLSRPAVEAGEKLGFLPGDLREKVDPYLQPLYDALHDMMPGADVQRMLDQGDVEIAPLAFMRGRTLSNAFVILDEAQNATSVQMRMFLTRLGENSRMVITGDPTQSDLPGHVPSGLNEAAIILSGMDDVGIITFGEADVVRHHLVTRIVRAYAAHDEARKQRRDSGA
ncbi:MAG TPA: PhoH family protein [Micropepsaceae bacterium]|nr:PhoH family protein [Micropepsaceae bacterium]